jgi:multicomponent Na+:H+ antiporter subunit F
MMNLVFAVVTVLLGAAALMAVFRVLRGPTILDRMVASEVFLVTVMCGLLVGMAYERDTYSLPLVLCLTLLSFVGSVSVARFVSGGRTE